MAKHRLEITDTGGLWRRNWLHTPESEDDSTCVQWMQGEQLHVDMRLPAAAMEFRHAPSLSALNAKQLRQQVESVVPKARIMTNSRGQTLVILWTATRFAMGHGWHERTIHTRSLPEHVANAISCNNNAVLARAFDQEFCVGRIEGGHGIIEYSTHPMRCDTLAFYATPLFSKARHIEVFTTDFFGQTSCQEYRVPARSPTMA